MKWDPNILTRRGYRKTHIWFFQLYNFFLILSLFVPFFSVVLTWCSLSELWWFSNWMPMLDFLVVEHSREVIPERVDHTYVWFILSRTWSVADYVSFLDFQRHFSWKFNCLTPLGEHAFDLFDRASGKFYLLNGCLLTFATLGSSSNKFRVSRPLPWFLRHQSTR